ncbi:MAG: hypothetical protein KKB51_12370 [Candidatus Riflebacteria bacterium]|nr:hypothetical protein [Candidatus Riflebacteria bacterium]
MRNIGRHGFVLYIVITVLLGLAIMAFALNSFKTGAVTQLSRNVDQNRLALVAQSANAEMIAMIKSRVNLVPGSNIFNTIRSKVFLDTASPTLPLTVELLSPFEPQETIKLAKVGYNLKVRSSAVLKVFRRSIYNSMLAYNGYIDLESKAWREGAGEITMEAHERRDVRLIDLRHTLDKYALFVKNYCNDYNNTSRRLIIKGVRSDDDPYDISRVFIGNDNYPTCKDPRKDLWFDLYYEDHNGLKGFAKIFGQNTLTSFPGIPAGYPVFNRLFYENVKPFNALGGVSVDMFVLNPQVVNEFERVINLAADACMVQAGVATEPYMVAANLREKCKRSIAKLSNPNAYAQMMCQDFVDKANGGNYSACKEFVKLLNTCQQNWEYRWGYTDAASLWNVYTSGCPPLNTTLPDRYAGLSSIAMGAGNYGPYMAEYRELVDGNQYNHERSSVGVMQQFYGEDNDVPVLIEGNAYLRFFKIAYLDEFTANVQFAAPTPVPVNIRVVTNKYLRKDKTGSFLTTQLGPQLAPNLFDDRFMKSRAIDELSLNTLWGEKIKCYNGSGQPDEYDPMQSPTTIIPRPAQPTGSTVEAFRFGRVVDFKNASWNYVSAADFLAERAPNDGRTSDGKTLYLDGFMYIAAGDLDLSGVTQFQGKGLIYIRQGNCTLGNLKRLNDPPTSDSLRIYLRRGDFKIDPAVDNVKICASLVAFYDPPQSDNSLQQGNIILNNRSNVTIYGNLLVDSLSLQDSANSGLAAGGKLYIEHDPAIYNAAATLDGTKLDPYHISIGPVKTSFSFRAGGSEI